MRWWPASLVHVPSCVCGVHIFDFERLGVCVLTSGRGALAGSRVHIVPKSFLMFSVMKVLFIVGRCGWHIRGHMSDK